MEWDRIEGNWKQFKGQARQKWGKLTDDEWDQIAGNRERLSGKLQEKYGYSKEMADKQINEFGRTLH
ncbi:MAG TPA: CsbD family protein [Gammaproteobacteria bacterium]|nr:CsbD family protein [Gammaproteobacteria bacterium]